MTRKRKKSAVGKRIIAWRAGLEPNSVVGRPLCYHRRQPGGSHLGNPGLSIQKKRKHIPPGVSFEFGALSRQWKKKSPLEKIHKLAGA